jgi:hypothetical protein
VSAPTYTHADAANPQWLAAANRNAKLKTAQFHLAKAARALDYAKQRIEEAGDFGPATTLNLETAQLTIDNLIEHVRGQRRALHNLYQLEY